MDFKDWYNKELANDKRSAVYVAGAKRGFKAGQQSKQAEIDALKAKIQELWTELDDRQSKEHIIEKCESIIKELLK